MTLTIPASAPAGGEGEDMPDAVATRTELASDPVWRRHDIQLSVVLVAGVLLTWLFFTG